MKYTYARDASILFYVISYVCSKRSSYSHGKLSYSSLRSNGYSSSYSSSRPPSRRSPLPPRFSNPPRYSPPPPNSTPLPSCSLPPPASCNPLPCSKPSTNSHSSFSYSSCVEELKMRETKEQSRREEPSSSQRHQSRSGFSHSSKTDDMNEFFRKVRESKGNRTQDFSSSSNCVAPSQAHEAGWSGVAFLTKWQEQHTHEGIPQFVVLFFCACFVQN